MDGTDMDVFYSDTSSPNDPAGASSINTTRGQFFGFFFHKMNPVAHGFYRDCELLVGASAKHKDNPPGTVFIWQYFSVKNSNCDKSPNYIFEQR